MSDTVWQATLGLIWRLCRKGTQTEVSLTGIGEAVLHPKFVEWVEDLRSVIGYERPLVVSTNGTEFRSGGPMTDFDMKRLADVRPHFFVSLHRPEVAQPAINRLKSFGIRVDTNTAFATSSLDWAGQVKWVATMARSECQYLRRGWGVVRQDGQITTCCMDAHTKHAFGTVFDPVGQLELKPHALCDNCQLDVPKEMRHVRPAQVE